MLRFVIGLVTGVAIGAAAATAVSGQSGEDLRAEFDRIRADIEKRDFDALGAHLEDRFKELQASLEEKFAEADAAADAAADSAADSADDSADEADNTAEEAAEEAQA